MKFLLIYVILFTFPCFGKVYDCFMFNHEIEVLQIRLYEMGPYVDHFVIVEWDKGHRKGNQKPCYFDQNRDKYCDFLEKIIHIKLDEEIDTDDGWIRENWHRNQIMRGLIDCNPEDVILISDVDEIIPGGIIKDLSSLLDQYQMIGFWQRLYQWFLNRDSGQVWSGTFAIKYKDLITTTPQNLRNEFRSNPHLPRYHMGWHFSSMGGYERTKEKYYNVVEGYDKWPTKEEWYEHIQTWLEVPIDHTYPTWVQENIEFLLENDLIDYPSRENLSQSTQGAYCLNSLARA